ncbi:hypothetical protein B0H66DRAFT_293962 [Apodospora peruviana]|uniref:Uncharacterized protein n=1 Tax=Apodospora peruviana TaxID=516989 RepID=A0AAE0I0S8_9PEZI|nr:hypothetical protein B0H66DRAFT_293962 [Apodospora peruviana]
MKRCSHFTPDQPKNAPDSDEQGRQSFPYRHLTHPSDIPHYPFKVPDTDSSHLPSNITHCHAYAFRAFLPLCLSSTLVFCAELHSLHRPPSSVVQFLATSGFFRPLPCFITKDFGSGALAAWLFAPYDIGNDMAAYLVPCVLALALAHPGCRDEGILLTRRLSLVCVCLCLTVRRCRFGRRSWTADDAPLVRRRASLVDGRGVFGV